MSRYLLNQARKTKKTPQTEAIPGREKEMVRNAAGGMVFPASNWTRMERFLILGSEGGTYYTTEQDLTKQNTDAVRDCLTENPARAVDLIVDVSHKGRAPKNDPALYALALAASSESLQTRRMALDALPAVARIGTHLFTFAGFIDSMRGWGTQLREAVGNWYLSKPRDALAYQLVKYRQRNGWTHKDLLRLSHPKAEFDAKRNELFRWAVGKGTVAEGLVSGFIEAQTASKKRVTELIRAYTMTHEMVPTEMLREPAIWEALLHDMPMTAMIRNLGRMSNIGFLVPFSKAVKIVVERLGNIGLLHRQRVHPITILAALQTYSSGKGGLGKLTWTPVSQVVDALNQAFYDAFQFVEGTGKNFFLGIDVSGSMNMGTVAGIRNLTPNMGAAAMAMLIARTEPQHFIGGFSTQFVNLGISKSDRLDTAMEKCHRSFGRTDTSVAIRHAIVHKMPVDVFVIITDGETWAGDEHTTQSLEEYRQKMGRYAKLVVINMVANLTSITDPRDLGSLDVVGFDASVPQVINSFIGGPAQHADAEPE